MRQLRFVLVAVLGFACGCERAADAPGADAPPAGTEARSAVPAGTPVEVAEVARATLAETLSAPGETVALVEQQVRAPFAGTVTALGVVEGDRVGKGEQIGVLVARDSEAALRGAEEMARTARSEEEATDARRALELARSHRVETPLLATASGVVVRRAASAGDQVAEDEELATIVAADSLVFRASLAQSDLARVRPGQRVEIDLAGSARPVEGRVHGLLAGANATDLTAPVRVDFTRLPSQVSVGLFGTARIVVEEHRDVQVVPAQAVLRDDLSGVTRVATVGESDRLHWVTVETGLRDGDRVEIAGSPLEPGTRVVLSGQVGLEEGAPLAIRP